MENLPIVLLVLVTSIVFYVGVVYLLKRQERRIERRIKAFTEANLVSSRWEERLQEAKARAEYFELIKKKTTGPNPKGDCE